MLMDQSVKLQWCIGFFMAPEHHLLPPLPFLPLVGGTLCRLSAFARRSLIRLHISFKST